MGEDFLKQIENDLKIIRDNQQFIVNLIDENIIQFRDEVAQINEMLSQIEENMQDV